MSTCAQREVLGDVAVVSGLVSSCDAARTSRVARLLLAAAVVLGSTGALADVGFVGLGDLPGGGFFSAANAISPDGSVVVGQSMSGAGYEAFVWTSSTGMLGLGDFPGGPFNSEAMGVSAFGNAVVGAGFASTGPMAFRWTSAGGMVALGTLPGGSSSVAYAIAADGSFVVGSSSSGAATAEAFRWSPGSGMQSLGVLPGGSQSVAFAVSGRGSVIAGFSGSTSGEQAFRWTETTGMTGLGDLPGGVFRSRARGISYDGSTIVGIGNWANWDEGEAFRWTEVEGMVGLGHLPGTTFSVAMAASGDGSIVVGYASSGTISPIASIWDKTNGMRALQDVLQIEYGLNLDGWTLTSVKGISADGLTMVGSGINPSNETEAWLVRIPEPSATTGLLLSLAAASMWRRRGCGLLPKI